MKATSRAGDTPMRTTEPQLYFPPPAVAVSPAGSPVADFSVLHTQISSGLIGTWTLPHFIFILKQVSPSAVTWQMKVEVDIELHRLFLD